MKIGSKAEFFKLWEAGLLGNRTRLWRDPQQAYKWAVHEVATKDLPFGHPLIGFREIRPYGAGAGKWERVSWLYLLDTCQLWDNEDRKYLLDDGCPDDKKTIQGEICRTIRGWEGFIDTVGTKTMRPAMAAGHMKPFKGAAVLAILHHYMDPSSMDDVYQILDLYPDATIEFSCFTVDVGVFPGRNTLFWEVRDY